MSSWHGSYYFRRRKDIQILIPWIICIKSLSINAIEIAAPLTPHRFFLLSMWDLLIDSWWSFQFCWDHLQSTRELWSSLNTFFIYLHIFLDELFEISIWLKFLIDTCHQLFYFYNTVLFLIKEIVLHLLLGLINNQLQFIFVINMFLHLPFKLLSPTTIRDVIHQDPLSLLLSLVACDKTADSMISKKS